MALPGRKMNPDLAPTLRPSLMDIAWVAGLFEGEGSCNGNNGQNQRVYIYQKDPYILVKCQRLFGGSVCQRSTGRNRFKTEDGGMIHRWNLYGPRGRGFLMTIYSLLSPRRKAQVKRALTGKEPN